MNQSDDQYRVTENVARVSAAETMLVGNAVREQSQRIDSLTSQTGELSNQMEYVLEWIQESNNKKYGIGPSTFTHAFVAGYPIPATSAKTTFVWAKPLSVSPSLTSDIPRPEASVPLHTILETGAIVAAFICCGSLATWVLNSTPILNPLAAVMGLIASPFFYAMGRASRVR